MTNTPAPEWSKEEWDVLWRALWHYHGRLIGEGISKASDNALAEPTELDLLLDLKARIEQDRACARGEHEILAELSVIEIPPSDEERLRSLERRNVEEWEYWLKVRQDRLARLRELNAPEYVLLREEGLVLQAEAGLAWMRYRELQMRLNGGAP